MKLKLIVIALFLSFSKLTQASVEPESFTGTFSTGDCSLSKAESASISFNGKSLNVKFAGDHAATEIFLETFEEAFSRMTATQESFAISNEYAAKVNEGMYLPVVIITLARSATGNRVRLSTLHYETNMTYECVLYRK